MCSMELLRERCKTVQGTAVDVWHTYTELGMEKLHTFSLTDLALFKTLLLSMGVYFGVKHANTLKKWKAFFAVVSVVLSAYFIWRFFMAEDEE